MTREARIQSRRWASIERWVIVITLLAMLLPVTVQALEWDQARATELATEMHLSIEALLADPGVEPRQETAIQQRKHSAALIVLKDLSTLSARLRDQLAEGRGRNPTQSLFEQISDVREQVGEMAQDSWVTASAQGKISSFRVALAALGDYYKD